MNWTRWSREARTILSTHTDENKTAKNTRYTNQWHTQQKADMHIVLDEHRITYSVSEAASAPTPFATATGFPGASMAFSLLATRASFFCFVHLPQLQNLADASA